MKDSEFVNNRAIALTKQIKWEATLTCKLVMFEIFKIQYPVAPIKYTFRLLFWRPKPLTQ